MKKKENNLNISIGDIPIAIYSDNGFIAKLMDIYSNFIVEEENPLISIEVDVVPHQKFGKKFDINEDSPDVSIDQSGELCKVLWVCLDGEFNLQTRKGILKCSDPINLSNFIRIIYSLILLEEPGFLVHASSLIKNGKGYLFPGKSGAGKTTITRLSPNATLLTDEVSLVKMVNGKFNIFGTPFWGELAIGGENVNVPLEATYFPSKAKENHINNLSPSQALQRLLPNVLFFIDSPEYKVKLFNLCNDFITTIPAKELHFLPEPTFWRMIDVG